MYGTYVVISKNIIEYFSCRQAKYLDFISKSQRSRRSQATNIYFTCYYFILNTYQRVRQDHNCHEDGAKNSTESYLFTNKQLINFNRYKVRQVRLVEYYNLAIVSNFILGSTTACITYKFSIELTCHCRRPEHPYRSSLHELQTQLKCSRVAIEYL